MSKETDETKSQGSCHALWTTASLNGYETALRDLRAIGHPVLSERLAHELVAGVLRDITLLHPKDAVGELAAAGLRCHQTAKGEETP